MAASSNKTTKLNDTLSAGSTEDLDILCDPCLTDDHLSEARAFCLTCQENLCKTCFDTHRKLKFSRNHRVQDKPHKPVAKSPDQQDPEKICSEPCTLHKDEVIKFFCRQHQAVCCNVCVTLTHRTCDVDYIRDVCTGIAKSTEYNNTLGDLAKTIKVSQDFEENVKTSLTGSSKSIKKAHADIEAFQVKINETIERMKNALFLQLKSHELNDNRQAEEVLSINQTVVSELKTLYDALQAPETSEQDARAYIIMKQSQSRLQALKCRKYLFETEMRIYTFEHSATLEDIISSSHCLGEIFSSTQLISAEETLECKKQINVRLHTDRMKCGIRGCAIVASGKLMLTDGTNMQVKILDVEKKSIVDQCSEPSTPFGVAILPQNQAAVTFPFNKEIKIMNIEGKLATVRCFKVKRMCNGIACFQDLLYVLCQLPKSVLVLDMQGNVHRDIPLTTVFEEDVKCPLHITINTNQQCMYVSDTNNCMVFSLSLQGEVIAVYKSKELKNPCGLTTLDDDSIMVCCVENAVENGAVQRISADMKHSHKVADGIPAPNSIFYDSLTKRVFVGSYNFDCISVFGFR